MRFDGGRGKGSDKGSDGGNGKGSDRGNDGGSGKGSDRGNDGGNGEMDGIHLSIPVEIVTTV
jgi:hypothetical protein